MKISDLIINLREIQMENGDLEVCVCGGNNPLQSPVTSVRMVEGFEEKTKILQMLMPSKLYRQDRVLIE